MPSNWDYIIPDLTDLNQEERIQLAIGEICRSISTSTGLPSLSIRRAHRDFDVPKSTLSDRYNGTPTRQESHHHERRLTNAQEDVLVQWIKAHGRRGVPLSASTITDHASILAGEQIGPSWHGRFMERHPDLKTRWTWGLEKCRATNLNRPTVNNFYDIYDDLITKYNIPQENIYNMDEKGVQLGVGKRVAAIVDRDQKAVYSVEDGDRELVTIIETVCADGTALKPTVIFQGKRTNLGWANDNPCGARYILC